VRGIITFLNKGADMLQKAFFKVNVVDRIYETPVFEKTTPGNYSFVVPEEYNYVVIEYAGAAGGGIVGSGHEPDRNGGAGSVKKISAVIKNIKISGIVGGIGASGGAAIAGSPVSQGGSGYSNGENGTQGSDTPIRGYSGAGGGSTSVDFNSVVYEASAGGGALMDYSGSYGGKGGGIYGGARKTSVGSGNNATDPNQIGLNSGNGYVKIWAGYDPYFKG
jgi:hypothetical protein